MAAIIGGAPGSQWTNNARHVYYQFVCDLVNTCGVCLQFHMMIGQFWPIPLHKNCRCRNVPVYPGDTAHPFVDFREVLDGLPKHQRNRVVGKSALGLIDKGIVAWDDVVNASRIRTLGEIISKSKLTTGDLIKAGMSRARAANAIANAETGSRATGSHASRSLASILESHGLSPQAILNITGVAVAAKLRKKDQSVPVQVESRKPMNATVPKASFPWLFLAWRDDDELTDAESLAILTAALGVDVAAGIHPLPHTVKALNQVLASLNAPIDAPAMRAMMEKLGVKP